MNNTLSDHYGRQSYSQKEARQVAYKDQTLQRLLNSPNLREVVPEEYFHFLAIREEFWREPASLRGHIANEEFSGARLASVGVPRYDLELVLFRKTYVGEDMDLTWVVNKVYEKLERKDPDIFRKDDSTMFYVTKVIKNLLYIELLELASVDWDRVESIFPRASNIDLDIDKDSNDPPFLKDGVPLIIHGIMQRDGLI